MVTGQRERAADGIYTHSDVRAHTYTHSDEHTGDSKFNHFGEKVEGSDGAVVSTLLGVSLDHPPPQHSQL